ncbi:uncharacterized protein LOC132946244 isoform X1 [Metopolophium dirhodum]|uniref:uncharacterized protein LOC132946244 isoform X1 n=1 Tax=Metopolophium dirhodum TaxID=44670 RepID=UPI00298FFDC5|nr:uncharacterized protein LOC132946244 isoform X1 [Metopolophium dirhodum]XP_060872111.1 uncharacterized protein LOC132946244 isoform X1 [Metopolophium dirhodum]
MCKIIFKCPSAYILLLVSDDSSSIVHFRQRRCHKRRAGEIGTKSAITVVVGDWRAYTYNVVIITAPRSCGGHATGHRKYRTPTLRSARARRDQLKTRQCRTNRLPATAATAVDPPPPTSCTTISSTRRVTACSAAAKVSYRPGGNCSRRFMSNHVAGFAVGRFPCTRSFATGGLNYTCPSFSGSGGVIPTPMFLCGSKRPKSNTDTAAAKQNKKKNCVTHRKNKYILNII